MTKFKKTCKTCNYYRYEDWLEPCYYCNNYYLWKCPDWLTDWLNSFDSSSATKCYEAIDLLKKEIGLK